MKTTLRLGCLLLLLSAVGFARNYACFNCTGANGSCARVHTGYCDCADACLNPPSCTKVSCQVSLNNGCVTVQGGAVCTGPPRPTSAILQEPNLLDVRANQHPLTADELQAHSWLGATHIALPSLRMAQLLTFVQIQQVKKGPDETLGTFGGDFFFKQVNTRDGAQLLIYHINNVNDLASDAVARQVPEEVLTLSQPDWRKSGTWKLYRPATGQTVTGTFPPLAK